MRKKTLQAKGSKIATTKEMKTENTTEHRERRDHGGPGNNGMWPQEVTTDEYYIVDPLGRGPKRRTTPPPPPPPQQQQPPQMRSPPRTPSGGDFASQLLASMEGLQLQPMFPDALDKSLSSFTPPQRQPQSAHSGGGYPTSRSYDSPRQPPPAPHQGYDNERIPPSPMQVYNMRQNSSHSNHSHGRNYETPRSSQNAYGYSSPLRNNEREERDLPPQSSSYDHSGSHHRLHQPQQHQYQSPHPDDSPHNSDNHNKYNGEREQQPPEHRQQQYHRHDDYNQRRISSNSNSTPPPREHYDSEYNRHSHSSRTHNGYDRAPVLENSNPQPQSQLQQQYYQDQRGHPNDVNRSDHHDRYYSPSKPQEYVTRFSPRESYREATYEEQTSPLSIPSFVGGPHESNNEDRFNSPPPYTSPQPSSPFVPSQQYSSPHHHHHYPKETIEGRRRRSTDAKQYRHDHYYPLPPPESRDDYTGSSSIPTSSTSKHRSPPPQGYHPSHSHRHGEYYAESPPRPPAQDARGHYLVDSNENTTHPPPVRPSYNNVNPERKSSSSLPLPNKMVPRYQQAEDNRRQSQARTQILKEIKQATSMRNSAVDDSDRKFWERQIATLNATFRKL